MTDDAGERKEILRSRSAETAPFSRDGRAAFRKSANWPTLPLAIIVFTAVPLKIPYMLAARGSVIVVPLTTPAPER